MYIHVHIHIYVYKYIHIFVFIYTYIYSIYTCEYVYIVIVQNNLQLYKTPAKDTPSISRYGVATISRLLKIIGLFCRT